MHQRAGSTLAGLLLGALALGAQTCLVQSLRGQERVLTKAPRNHRDPKISPDGSWVAYASRGSLFVQATSGKGVETLAYKGGNPQYFWESGSFTMVVLDAGSLLRVSRTAQVTRIADLSKQNPNQAFALSPDGQWLYGTRLVSVFIAVFRVSTASGKVEDLITGIAGIKHIDIDPSGKTLLISSIPQFGQWTFYTADADGKNLVNLLDKTPFKIHASNGMWIDNGKGFLFEHIDLIQNQGTGFQLWHFDVATKQKTLLSYLPGHRKGLVSFSPDRSWVAIPYFDPFKGSFRAVTFPRTGGAELPLSAELLNMGNTVRYSPKGGALVYVGADGPGKNVQVRIFDLARPLGLSPALKVGRASPWSQQLQSGASGVLFLGSGLASSPIQLPGFDGLLELDPLQPVLVLGGGTAPSFGGILPVPNNPVFAGKQVFFQTLEIAGTKRSFHKALFASILP
ncbi:MAG: TolB family protein [Planctomycetota bacterium]